MSLTTLLLIVWGVVTAVFVVLLIYRSTLSMQEDDQLFLDESESHMQKEQAVVLRRLEQLQWPLRFLGGASGLLLLAVFGVWLYRGLNSM
jgi:Tfp pilus assembly protein PilN